MNSAPHGVVHLDPASTAHHFLVGQGQAQPTAAAALGHGFGGVAVLEDLLPASEVNALTRVVHLQHEVVTFAPDDDVHPAALALGRRFHGVVDEVAQDGDEPDRILEGLGELGRAGDGELHPPLAGHRRLAQQQR